jgi:5'-3' exoribonuclease 1
MGIPHIFRHLAVAHPHAIRALPPEAQLRCRYLFVDFNGIVHLAAASVVNTGVTKGPAQGPADVDVESAVIERSMQHLDSLIRQLGPAGSTFVAVDGKAPRAKMEQQRGRRFMSTLQPASVWDGCAVTPGTDFMLRLRDALADFKRRHAPGSVIVSDDGEVGEGEQKIFDRIARTVRRGDACIVYGMDADLILMALLNDAYRDLRIVREQHRGSNIQVIDVTKLHASVSAFMRTKGGFPREEPDEALAKEFVALCLLLGNDFLPTLACLRIRERGVERIMDLYGTVRREAGLSTSLLTRPGDPRTGGYNTSFLSRLLSAAGKHEETWVRCLEASIDQRKKRSRQMPARFRDSDDVTMLEEQGVGTLVNDTTTAAAGCWRAVHNRRRLMCGMEDEPESTLMAAVRAACLSYVSGLAWSLAYFQQRCMSHGWYYSYAHAPSCVDLALCASEPGISQSVSEALEQSHVEYERFYAGVDVDLRGQCPGPGPCQGPGQDIRPAPIEDRVRRSAHLALVLPPSSARLIPSSPVRRVMRSAALGCVHMYPVKFRLSTYLKEKTWECKPVLPHVDMDVLRRGIADGIAGRHRDDS